MRKKTATVGHVFEEEFALESLKSDRLRVSILIGSIVSSVTILFLLKGREQSIQVYQVA